MADHVMKQHLVDDIRSVLHQVDELLESTSDASGTSLDAARQRLSNGAENLRGQCRRLQREAGDTARATGRVIKEHPYETAGAGVAMLAIVAGALWLWQRCR